LVILSALSIWHKDAHVELAQSGLVRIQFSVAWKCFARTALLVFRFEKLQTADVINRDLRADLECRKTAADAEEQQRVDCGVSAT